MSHDATSQVHRRNSRRYLWALAASLVGNSAMSLAAGIWVKTLTGSDSAAGLVAVAIYAPSLAGPLVGAWVDRVRRRPLLVAANLASAVSLLPLLLVRTADQVWIILVVMALYGVSLVVVDPAENALFAVMLPRDGRERMNGLRMALQEGGRVVAPLLGAGLFAVVGGGAVALVDAASFLVAALVVSRLELSEPRPTRTAVSWRDELLAGFRHIGDVAVLRLTTVAAAIAMVVAGILTPAQYALVESLGRQPSFLGVLSGVLGAGSVVAGLTSAAAVRRIGERRLAAVGLVNAAIGWSLYATTSLPLVLLGAAVLGFALPWIVVAVVNLAQRCTSDDLQGRVSAAVIMALFAPQPLAHAAGAAAIAVIPQRVLYGAGAVAALATAAILAWGTTTNDPATPSRSVGSTKRAHDPLRSRHDGKER